MKNKHVQNEFVLILMEAFDKGTVEYPKEELINIDNDIDGDADEINALFDLFEINVEGIIFNDEFRDIITENNFNFTVQKMRKLLKGRYPNVNWNYKNKKKGVKGLRLKNIPF